MSYIKAKDNPSFVDTIRRLATGSDDDDLFHQVLDGVNERLLNNAKAALQGTDNLVRLILSERASCPWTPEAGKGAIWVKNDTPSTLWFTDDTGADTQLGSGGGPSYWQRVGGMLSPTTITDPVGVGTATPQSMLDVFSGKFNVHSDDFTWGQAQIIFDDGAGGTGESAIAFLPNTVGGQGWVIGAGLYSHDPLIQFVIASLDTQMVVNHDGEFGFGTGIDPVAGTTMNVSGGGGGISIASAGRIDVALPSSGYAAGFSATGVAISCSISLDVIGGEVGLVDSSDGLIAVRSGNYYRYGTNFGTGNTAVVVDNTNGRVNIGADTAPLAQLHIGDAGVSYAPDAHDQLGIYVSNTSDSPAVTVFGPTDNGGYLRLGDSDSGTFLELRGDANGPYLDAQKSTSLKFFTDSNEKLRISTEGYVQFPKLPGATGRIIEVDDGGAGESGTHLPIEAGKGGTGGDLDGGDLNLKAALPTGAGVPGAVKIYTNGVERLIAQGTGNVQATNSFIIGDHAVDYDFALNFWADTNDGLLTWMNTEARFVFDHTVAVTGDISQLVHVDDVSSPPTDAELDGIFGTPAAAGAGFTAYIDDGGAGTDFYQIVSDGTNWWIFYGSKAV